LKYAILFGFLLGSASALAQTTMPAPTRNGSNSGWDNSQTRAPLSGSDPADRVGTFQIMLQGPPLVASTLQQPTEFTGGRGVGISQPIVMGGTMGYVGVSGALGYTLSSVFELGAGVSFGLSGDGAGGTVYNFLVEPFVKLNLGPAFKTGALNPFVLAGPGIGVLGNSGDNGAAGSSTGVFAIDIDPGLEWLVGGRWGFDFYVPLDFAVPLTSGNIGLNIGVGYGLVAYL
jgi:hypothetical protein